jgi:hypothetical protein
MPTLVWLLCLAQLLALQGCAIDPSSNELKTLLAQPLAETNATKSSADVQRELEAAGWLTLPRTGAARNPTLNFILPPSLEQVDDITLVTTRAVLGADPNERTTSLTITSQWEVQCKAATARVVQTETSLDVMGQRRVDRTDASGAPMQPYAAVPMALQVARLACPTPPTAGSGVIVAPGQVLTASAVTRLCLGVDVVMGGQRFPASLTTEDANNHQSMLTVPNLPVKRALSLGRVGKGGEPVVVAGYRPGGSLLGDVELTAGFIQAQPPGGTTNTTPLSALLLPTQIGGPMLSRSGQLLGVVLARPGGFAAVQSEVVSAFLALSWATLPAAKATTQLSNEALLGRARDITVKVECLGRPAPLIGSR